MHKIYITFLIVIGNIFICSAQTNNLIIVNDDIQLIRLEDSIYIHVSWHTAEPYGRFPSNGMIIIRNGKAIMIDTPFDTEKTKILADFVRDSLHSEITTFIAGHYHDDNIGGLKYLHEMGITSYANYMTVKKCKELQLPVPKISFKDSLHLNLNGENLILKYFGPGHTVDNITVYLPDKKILFGGCLIKSVNSNKLGNTADAIISEWDKSVEKILKAYPELTIVIPGHGKHGGKELLTHTIELVKQYKTHNNE